jgi:hypothetical protein
MKQSVCGWCAGEYWAGLFFLTQMDADFEIAGGVPSL